uniref:ribosomal protein S3 n=1 Tax=Ulva meridionalis TaxID=434723 RepID=UPI0028E0A03F|nr:ribosomal protein S3 [Ulva meridionalis]WFS80062.1 ribosomal protein S3 [Ulva meridionalis]
MGQKVHPLGLRLGITQKHRSVWFSKFDNYPSLILEDKNIRSYIFKKYSKAHIIDVLIKRYRTTQNIETKEPIDLVEVSINTALPSKILNRKNTKESLTELKGILENICYKQRLNNNFFNSLIDKKFHTPKVEIILNVFKVEDIYSEASVLADYLIQQLEERVPFRSALKKTLNRTRFTKLKGIKIQISGRLNGAEIARTEWVRKGRVPLQTLRADIDYSYKTAKTIYGILGIKVWLFKGEKT